MLYVVPPYARSNTAAFDSFLDTLRSDGASTRRRFVLGELEQIHPTKYGYRYQLAGQRARQVVVRTALHQRLNTAYRNALGQAGTDAGGRRILIAYIERSPNGYAIAIDAAVMLTNIGWIPADSSYEVRAADALTAAGRGFTKPVRYDGDAVFPDFVLTDEPSTSYMEVWGLPGRADYEARKRIKQRHYRLTGARLYEWDIREPMPLLTLP